MKTRKKYLHLFIMLLGLLLLFCAGMTVSADREAQPVMMKGVAYYLNDDHTATAHIDNVRGDDLPTELYIPRKIKHRNVKYKVKSFNWSSDSDKYMDWKMVAGDTVWKRNVAIPDKQRSYQACLKKITIAKGVEVWGMVYGYEQLRQVILEDPNDLKQALFYNCPKLKRLHIPAGVMKNVYAYDIKNCPSLKITLDKKSKHLKMVGNDIVKNLRNGLKGTGRLLNVNAGKKNYKVPKETRFISRTALWGNTTIETIHLRKSTISGICGLPNLKSIKVNKKGDESHKLFQDFYWDDMAYCPSLRTVEVPESVRYIWGYSYGLYNDWDPSCYSPIKDVYLYSTKLKGGGNLEDIPADTTFHVRNKQVSKKLRKFGFKGNIVIEKNMK